MCLFAHHLTKRNDFYIVVIWAVRQLTFSQLSIRSEGRGILFCHCHCNNEFHWLYCEALHGEWHWAFSVLFITFTNSSPRIILVAILPVFLATISFISFSNWKVICLISSACTYVQCTHICLFVCSCMHSLTACNRLHFRNTHTLNPFYSILEKVNQHRRARARSAPLHLLNLDLNPFGCWMGITCSCDSHRIVSTLSAYYYFRMRQCIFGTSCK